TTKPQDTEEASRQALAEVNKIRVQYGRNPIAFDPRVFRLAIARLEDMTRYRYYDHVNSETGTCAETMKAQFGLLPTEYVAENIIGIGPKEHPVTLRHWEIMQPSTAIQGWMDSRGHRFNLLYPDHTAGALVCRDKCIFLGLNTKQFGGGACHSAEEGLRYWKNAPQRPGEAQYIPSLPRNLQ
ncbi:MAG TPA: CAP domain-containing protein, partial [Chroococcidiopsis sp.]